MQDYEYDIAGKPCGPIRQEARLIHIPDWVIELYPDDPDLKPVDAVSYMEAPLLGLDGKILGHLAVLDTQPMLEAPRSLALFQIFATRATAELQHFHAEADVRKR